MATAIGFLIESIDFLNFAFGFLFVTDFAMASSVSFATFLAEYRYQKHKFDSIYDFLGEKNWYDVVRPWLDDNEFQTHVGKLDKNEFEERAFYHSLELAAGSGCWDGFPLIEKSWKIEKTIARGGQGITTFAKRSLDATMYRDEPANPHLLEVIKFANLEYGDGIKEELNSLSKFGHPNIVNALKVNTHQGVYYLVMPNAGKQSLLELLGKLTPLEVLNYAKSTLKGLIHVHEISSRPHGDIKPENLVVDDYQHLKIVDFGIHHLVGKASVGTPGYMAAEQDNCNVNTKSDIYSLGKTIFALITGINLACETLDKKHSWKKPSQLSSGVTPEIDELYFEMTQRNPDLRPDAKEAMVRIEEIIAQLRPKENNGYRFVIMGLSEDPPEKPTDFVFQDFLQPDDQSAMNNPPSFMWASTDVKEDSEDAVRNSVSAAVVSGADHVPPEVSEICKKRKMLLFEYTSNGCGFFPNIAIHPKGNNAIEVPRNHVPTCWVKLLYWSKSEENQPRLLGRLADNNPLYWYIGTEGNKHRDVGCLELKLGEWVLAKFDFLSWNVVPFGIERKQSREPDFSVISEIVFEFGRFYLQTNPENVEGTARVLISPIVFSEISKTIDE